jgi:hypothetical protein
LFGDQPYPEAEVVMTICQPRYVGKDPIRSVTVTADYVYQWKCEELKPKAERVWDENPSFSPDEETCRWCSCSGNCSARHSQLLDVAMIDFDTEQEPKLPSVRKLTHQQKMLIVKHGAMIKKFVDDVYAAVRDEMDQGSKSYADHFKLVAANTKRRWTDNAFDTFSDIWDYLSEDEVYERRQKGITEIESALKNKMTKVKLTSVMNSLTVKPEGGLALAPVTDKRLPQQPSVITDFDEL